MSIRGELHLIEFDLAVGDLNIWEWWECGFERFTDWCHRWSNKQEGA